MWFIATFLALLLMLAFFGVLLNQSKDFNRWLKSQQHSFSYRRQPCLFSPAERSFFGVLEQVVGAGYKVFGKVRIADLIKPSTGNGAGRYAALKRITGKHVDFVICDSKTLFIIGVIELDDKSHNQNSRKKRDSFVNDAFSSAGIPIIRFPARAAYNVSSIRDTISQAFQIRIPEHSKPTPPKPITPLKVVSICDFHQENDPE
jgi:very-short-patch-repair endonuclease